MRAIDHHLLAKSHFLECGTGGGYSFAIVVRPLLAAAQDHVCVRVAPGFEDGSHAQLLARRGAYYRLWSRQAGGFVLDDGTADGSGGKVGRRDTEEIEEETVDAQGTPEEVIGHDRNPKRKPARERRQ